MKIHERLADALERVRKVTEARGTAVVRSGEMRRGDREFLAAHQWLQEIIRGWYLLTRPDVPPGDSGPWYSHFWEFLQHYLEVRFGDDYCLSAESSLLLHTGYSLIPKQVVVIVSKGAGNPIQLPFDTSLSPYADSSKLPEDCDTVRSIRVMPLPLALIRATPSFFEEESAEVQIALKMVRDVSELSGLLVAGGHPRAGARLIGAYEAMGDEARASRLGRELREAGMQLPRPVNPFGTSLSTVRLSRSPYAGRIEVSWASLRSAVEPYFPKPPGLPQDGVSYMRRVEELYRYDAYHSLSIEGYQVSPTLIDKVRNHGWSPEGDNEDQKTHQALAARGYFEAFTRVKATLVDILAGDAAADRVETDLPEWYRALWAPQVRAGIFEPHHVMGYRRNAVYIRGSRHTPPPREALPDTMEAFFECMKREEHPAVRAIVGHYLFVFIHPYPDGNGRIARFLMNAMLASGGYPWTIIRVEDRPTYFQALETTHETGDIGSFAKLVSKEMEERW